MEGDGAPVAISGKEAVDAVVVDGELTEDEKIEKFFALIRNYKEARERRRIALDPASDDDDQRREKKIRTVVGNGDQTVSSWIPAFKLEDFPEDSRIRIHRSPASSNVLSGGDCMHRRNDRPTPDADGGGLDLNLRL